MWDGKTVCVIFPAYNEAPNVSRAVSEFLEIRDAAGRRVVDEVLVVDNNSIDNTGALALAAGARVVEETRQGYGAALRRGLQEATHDLVVLCEPDGTFVATDLFKLLAYSSDFEMVCGTRTTRELIWAQANMGWFLRVGNVVVAKLLQVLYGTCSLSDCGCTFRLFRASAVKRILPDLHVTGSHFLPNTVIAARRNKVNIIEIPVTYRGRVGCSKITGTIKGTVLTATRMLRLILQSWPAYFLSSLLGTQHKD